jgi:malate dehydrogenase (quinone)
MTAAAFQNSPLTGYLIGQVLQSQQARINALREFVPTAKNADWKLMVAGQRVQIVKKDAKRGGVLQFGTEVVFARDGSIAALLGASPGASTAVAIMLELMADCFPDQLQSLPWQARLKEMIPSYGSSLIGDVALDDRINSWTREVLGLREEAALVAQG